MEIRIQPLEVQLGVALLGALAALALLAIRLLPARFAAARVQRALDAVFAVLAAAGGIGFCVLSAHPQHFVKTWDVQHTWFGARYAPELGYFRLYTCLLALDAQGAGLLREIDAASDLRRPTGTLPRAELLRGSECEERFDPERRRRFLADLAFFHALPQQPNLPLWFADNGYNQTPAFTALVAPLFERLPLRYGTLLGFTLVDPVLIAAALLLTWRSFGARVALVAATVFFTEVPNQWNVMGGSILRYGYVCFAIFGACALARGRARAAGAAFGVAALLQIFPAVWPGALALQAALRRLRGEPWPAWLPGLLMGFAATVAAGAALSVAVVGAHAWPEFFAKIGLHGQILSLYRIGIKACVLLDHFLTPAPDYDYAAAVAALAARWPLHAAAAALVALGALSLARRVGPLGFGASALAAVLFVLTPVHYYFSVLVLLLLVDRAEAERPAWAATAAALLLWSAAGYAALLATGSRAFVNSAVLSPGLFAVLAVHVAVWHVWRRNHRVDASLAS
jgi:hypothetical protein